jgi:hypothetical protein
VSQPDRPDWLGWVARLIELDDHPELPPDLD